MQILDQMILISDGYWVVHLVIILTWNDMSSDNLAPKSHIFQIFFFSQPKFYCSFFHFLISKVFLNSNNTPISILISFSFWYFSSPDVRAFLSLDNSRNAQEPVDSDSFYDSDPVMVSYIYIYMSLKLQWETS